LNSAEPTFVGHHGDGVGTGSRDQLQTEHPEAAGSTPDQDVIAGLERVRRMTEQHAISRRKRQRIAGRLFPGQMRRLLHQLPRLHATELRERTIWRFITPDALRRRQQRIAAITVLVVAVVLIAVDDDFIADLPALHLGAHRPYDA
jgi:hypothetical protein